MKKQYLTPRITKQEIVMMNALCESKPEATGEGNNVNEDNPMSAIGRRLYI